MDDEWGPWIDHDGSGCKAYGMFVEIVTRDGKVKSGLVGSLNSLDNLNSPFSDWVYQDTTMVGRKVDKYRIRKPLGLTMLEHLLSNLDTTIEQDRVEYKPRTVNT